MGVNDRMLTTEEQRDLERETFFHSEVRMRQWVFCLSVSQVKGRCLPSLHLYRSFPMFSTGITGRSIEQASEGPDGVVSSILNCLCFRTIQADILHNHFPHPFIVLYIIQASEHLSFSSWLVWTLLCPVHPIHTQSPGTNPMLHRHSLCIYHSVDCRDNFIHLSMYVFSLFSMP